MSTDAYLRHPAVFDDRVVFASEDDLWEVPLEGGVARRLTSGRGVAMRPIFSPDGAQLAFTSSDEHHPEAWVMPADGGPAQRLSYTGAIAGARAWSPEGDVIVASSHEQAFASLTELYAVAPGGGPLRRLGLGPASEIAWSETGAVVLGRHTIDPARWKRYRGGRAGQLWIDRSGTGTFRRILRALGGNLGSPMWVGRRVFFISDHEGTGNVYSCTATGADVRRHTRHDDFYARMPTTDGRTIVYHAGAELYRLDALAGGEAEPIDVELHSPRAQRGRRLVDPYRNLQGYSVHPDGHSVALEVRGQVHSMPLWERAPRRWDSGEGVRSRHGTWLAGGERFIAITDRGGEDGIDVFDVGGLDAPRRLALDVGRPIHVVASPTDPRLAITNHRHELLLVDVDKGTVRELDRSEHDRIGRPAWSPDGRWIAYSHPGTARTSSIRLAAAATGKLHEVTRSEFRDHTPAFDPKGRYLYFLSWRSFEPVYDSHTFDLGFPRGARPMLVTLAADTRSPFERAPRGFGSSDGSPAAGDGGDGSGGAAPKAAGKKPRPAAVAAAKPTATKQARAKQAADKADAAAKVEEVRIDLDGLPDRVVSFPMAEGRYEQVAGTGDKVLFVVREPVGKQGWDDPDHGGRLESFDLASGDHDVLVHGIDSFRLSGDGSTLVYRTGRRLRALKAGDKPDSAASGTNRSSGWLDLARVRVSIDPPAEWRQMLLESWRLQRDHFWVADMSGVGWEGVRDRYLPLVDRIGSRAEFSDLVWELQGELGTSHAYEYGGEQRAPYEYGIGRLGAELEVAPRSGRWTISRIMRGDSWDARRGSPLAAPGLGVAEGSTLLAVAGRRIEQGATPHELLVGHAGTEVELTIGDARGRRPRTVSVRTLWSEADLRYRDWVERNRAAVHERTEGRVGYVHIPDMGPRGFGEFHRSWPNEAQRGGLVVDVRCNGGGHVSQLLLEKLARRALGFGLSRWGAPESYPSDAVLGPTVAITNEVAGSDGDIFSHSFKMLGLGPLVGMRTWGGVIGINPTHPLADGSLTTQPEYAFWFHDAGFAVENYGTDPDHEVDIAPHDYLAGRDPQLDKALELMGRLLRRTPGELPEFGEYPVLASSMDP